MPRALVPTLVLATLASLAAPALAQADCSGFWVSPTDVPASAGKGEVTLTVYSAVGCAFTVGSTDPWLGAYPDAFTAESTASSVDVFWEAATGTERTGSIYVQAPSGETQLVTVRQAGACAFSVDRTLFEFEPAGGSGHFVVGTDDACAWSVTADYWITVDGSTRTGTGLVDFTVGENVLASGRGGALVIAQKTVVSVVQSAPPNPDPYADEEPTPPSDDAGFIENWVADSLVESPAPAWPFALAALAAVAVLARRRAA